MMDDMERRAGFYVSTNGTRSDLSIVVVITFLGKSASLGADSNKQLAPSLRFTLRGSL